MKRIEPCSAFYIKAQTYLKKLFGWENMYIAPWKHAALSVDGILIYKKQLFLAKRAAHLEYPGFWHVPAGHINISSGEGVLEALKRSIMQEHNIDIDISKIDVDSPVGVNYVPSMDYNAQKDVALMNIHYVYELSDEEYQTAITTSEATAFDVFSIKCLEDLKSKGKLVRKFDYIYHLLN